MGPDDAADADDLNAVDDGIELGPNRYGKAETHVVRVVRDPADPGRHEVVDLTVGVALAGDLHATHLAGDNRHVLPTDTQKNTVFAFAREHGIGSPERFGLLLARHFVTSRPAITHARVTLEQALWRRLEVAGAAAPHSFVRDGTYTRTALVTHGSPDGGPDRTRVVSGLRDLVVMNSTDSQFWGFDTDRYTTLAPTTDRVLATAVTAAWRHADVPGGTVDPDWNGSFEAVLRHLLDAFVETSPSLALQQTLYAMGRRVLRRRPEIDEVRLSMPNKHHFAVDLAPFGLDNPGEVFFAADRPYGLIEGSVRRARSDGRSGNEAADEGAAAFHGAW